MEQDKHDVFISFSFKDQKVSEYVAKELSDKYNIPSWICTNEILAGEHYKSVIVDATRPTMDQRIEELSRQIYAVLDKNIKISGWNGSFRDFKLLSTPTITPKKIFLGRDLVLEEIEKNFKSGENVLFWHRSISGGMLIIYWRDICL